ncbi:hypothetical protein [Parabacteroides sp. AF17-28]|uniref:hypothetical protein n=1 Tax=Parabacteroides sp. AF17-28 TaxID=2292241 RepID=UPI000EFFC4A3|nr:hypothetical protein [Parabacteroides sp. AF17-28]RHR58794.1 hypothetical protein DWW90_09880 [Parabacteroides sp. AF17-28]
MDTSLKLEADKAELARAILSIENDDILEMVKHRLYGLLNLKKRQATIETDKDAALHRLAGIWKDNPEVEKISEAIKQGRQNNTTRHIVSFDE